MPENMSLDDVTVLPLAIGEEVSHDHISARLIDHAAEVECWIVGDHRSPIQHMLHTPMGRQMLTLTHPDTRTGVGLAVDPRDGKIIGWVRLDTVIDMSSLDGGVPPEWKV